MADASISTAHRRRPREVCQSAGWPCRDTSVEARLEPVVHEVKVQRSDLLADLRKSRETRGPPAARQRVLALIRAGIAQPDEIPAECGVMIAADAAGAGEPEMARPAPRRVPPMPFGVWMALARATPLPGWRLEDAQCQLGDTRGLDSEF